MAGVGRLYTSPLRRAVQTGQVIADDQGVACTAFGDLLDLDFGQWQGLTIPEVQDRFPGVYQTWCKAPHTVTIPGGEGLRHVRRRVARAIDELARRHHGQVVALVGHAVVNRVMLCRVLGVSNEAFWRFGQDPCAVSVFTIRSDGALTLELMNDTSHLLHGHGDGMRVPLPAPTIEADRPDG